MNQWIANDYDPELDSCDKPDMPPNVDLPIHSSRRADLENRQQPGICGQSHPRQLLFSGA